MVGKEKGGASVAFAPPRLVLSKPSALGDAIEELTAVAELRAGDGDEKRGVRGERVSGWERYGRERKKQEQGVRGFG